MAAPVRPGRVRALAALGFVMVLVLCMVAGLGYLVISAIRDDEPTSTGPSDASISAAASATPAVSGSMDVSARQDALAAQPMLQLPESAAQPQPLVDETAGPPILIPSPTARVVPGGPPVATGFPHTPQGALAQLAAIDEAALSTTDLDRVHEVYAWAAAPGAVAEAEWSPGYAVRVHIDNFGGREQALRAQAVFQAVQGQIKGTVGKDFVVACVLGELTVTAASVARAGVGDCQRMVWRDGRWWIGPGTQPAYAPSAWPGSADAVRAGWRELRRA